MKWKYLSSKEQNAFINKEETFYRHARFYSRRANFELAIYIAVVLILALAVRAFVFEPIVVSGPSMNNTLVDGERMFVEKVSYWFAPPKRGDIIICYYQYEDEFCVKRVIGLPGETISVADGRVFINGEALDEGAYWNDEILLDTQERVVPEDTVFVMGDNRNLSLDSRSDRVGPIDYKYVVGQARYVIWPFANLRSLL